ncbi:MAG: hypothetical protein AAFX09_12910 [Pseudomonadota bacterium]
MAGMNRDREFNPATAPRFSWSRIVFVLGVTLVGTSIVLTGLVAERSTLLVSLIWMVASLVTALGLSMMYANAQRSDATHASARPARQKQEDTRS